MQIFVRLLSGRTLTFDVSATDTIATLKEKIQGKEGIDPSLQRLVYSGNNLEDAKTLGDHDVPHEAMIYLINSASATSAVLSHAASRPTEELPLPAPAPTSTIQVAVAISANERYIFIVNPNATTDALIRLVAAKTTLNDPTRIILYHGQYKLDPQKTLAEQHITNDASMNAVTTTPGGL